MPVKFYPEKPINLLEQIIIKDDGRPLYGEIEIYRQLHYSCSESKEEWHIWHDLKIPFHSHESNPLNKSEAQIDFLVLCKEGLLVIEVKGGKIYYSNRRFYSDPDLLNPLPQNPFDQVNGYKVSLIERIIAFDKRVFVTACIAFPHSTFNVSSEIIDTDIIWAKNKFNQQKTIKEFPDFAEFILSLFAKKKKKLLSHHRNFKNLSGDQTGKLLRYFNPSSIPLNTTIYPSVLEWLNIQNLDLFNCLKSNRRLMIEGGPGTGKTTFALAYIDERREKKGLFICWNRLLKASIERKLYHRNLQKCDVIGFGQISQGEIASYGSKGYDYLVIDEGQDLFERGIDLFMDSILENGQGLSHGNILFLYDIDQSYSNKSSDVRDFEYLLRDYFSHFRLNENKRSAQYPAIKKLSSDIINGNIDSLIQYFDEVETRAGVSIVQFDSNKRALHYLRNVVSKRLRSQSDESNGSNSILLIESSLFSSNRKYDGFDINLIDFSNFEELNETNSGLNDNVFRYTTPLKYKGMESKFVFFLCKDVNEFNYYELYVGITRAIYHIELLVIKGNEVY